VLAGLLGLLVVLIMVGKAAILLLVLMLHLEVELQVLTAQLMDFLAALVEGQELVGHLMLLMVAQDFRGKDFRAGQELLKFTIQAAAAERVQLVALETPFLVTEE
jgi:hypothetical protein